MHLLFRVNKQQRCREGPSRKISVQIFDQTKTEMKDATLGCRKWDPFMFFRFYSLTIDNENNPYVSIQHKTSFPTRGMISRGTFTINPKAQLWVHPPPSNPPPSGVAVLRTPRRCFLMCPENTLLFLPDSAFSQHVTIKLKQDLCSRLRSRVKDLRWTRSSPELESGKER